MFRPDRALRIASLILCLSLSCLAAEAAAAAQPPATPAPVRTPSEGNAAAEARAADLAKAREAMKAGATPVTLEHDGTDTLGAKLALSLRETLNTGTLLALNDRDVPKLHLLISTAAEFPSRPAVGSVYSVIWLYTERSSVLSTYLAHETGLLTPEDLDGLAARLASRTAGLASKHSYIFKK